MRLREVKLGMRVVPHAKTPRHRPDYHGLDTSFEWRMAIENNQPFLYVLEKHNGECVLSHTGDVIRGGDYFDQSDFDPYVDPVMEQTVEVTYAWLAIHFDISSAISNCDSFDEHASNLVRETYDREGSGGMYGLAYTLTKKFSDIYKDKIADGAYFETINEFLKKELYGN